MRHVHSMCIFARTSIYFYIDYKRFSSIEQDIDILYDAID